MDITRGKHVHVHVASYTYVDKPTEWRTRTYMCTRRFYCPWNAAAGRYSDIVRGGNLVQRGNFGRSLVLCYWAFNTVTTLCLIPNLGSLIHMTKIMVTALKSTTCSLRTSLSLFNRYPTLRYVSIYYTSRKRSRVKTFTNWLNILRIKLVWIADCILLPVLWAGPS